MDEAEKEYKKMFERISESREAMKVFTHHKRKLIFSYVFQLFNKCG